VNDYLTGALGPNFQDMARSVDGRKTMIDRSHALSLKRRARELGIRRGSVYYLPKPVSPADLAIMRRIDELHLEFPFAGSRMLQDMLQRRHQDRPSARRHADEADADRVDLPPSEHIQAGAGAQDRPVFAAQAGDCATRSGLGDQYHLHSDGKGLRLSGGHRRLVQPQGAGPRSGFWRVSITMEADPNNQRLSCSTFCCVFFRSRL